MMFEHFVEFCIVVLINVCMFVVFLVFQFVICKKENVMKCVLFNSE